MKSHPKWASLIAHLPKRIAARSQSSRDLIIILAVAIFIFVISAIFDVFDKIIAWIYKHNTWQLDELFTVAIYLLFGFAVYAWRRRRELLIQIRSRERAEAAHARLIPKLETALADVSKLKKLLPICSSCKRVRDAKGYWSQVEDYIEMNLQTRLDGGLCPDCAKNLYGDVHKSARQSIRIQRRSN
jgi:hypothetical protein